MSFQHKTLGPLLEMGNLASRRTRAEQIEHAMRTALLLTEADAVVLLSPSARRGERLVLHSGSATPAIVPAHPSGSEVARLIAEDGQILVLDNLADRIPCAQSDACPGVEAGPVLYTPLRQREPLPGYLAVYRRYGRGKFTFADSQSMLLLSAWLGLALENLRLSSGMERLAVTDGLTEVYNARFLRTALRRELRRASRFSQELSLVLVELDQLTAFQAEKGEMRAGALLRELASLLAGHMRSFDLVARADDDRFMLILPQTGDAGAREVAERMRVAVERNAFSGGPAGAITASFGVASFPREGGDIKALTAAVKRALGQARQRGSNSVCGLDRVA